MPFKGDWMQHELSISRANGSNTNRDNMRTPAAIVHIEVGACLDLGIMKMFMVVFRCTTLLLEVLLRLVSVVVKSRTPDPTTHCCPLGSDSHSSGSWD